MMIFKYLVAAADILVFVLFAVMWINAKKTDSDLRLSCGFIATIVLFNFLALL